ncbi:MAG: helix-turn-helix transcriptional regulator [Desulfovibrionaceae bacterium]|nr:helix-turn-helix transcriptional regulator [Desulfovibrionaceae bacterium]
MQFPTPVNSIQPTRQESLRLYLGRAGLSFREIGRRIDVSGAAIAKLCNQETMPTRRHAELIAMGIPAGLLPEPLDIKPGPKPRVGLAMERE